MERNTEGRLTATERRELETLVDTVEMLSLENARLLARQSQRTKTTRRTTAPRGKQPA
jgi:hypothetical protein